MSEINPYAIAVRAQELIEVRDKIERLCWGVADGSVKPGVAADLILARMIRDTPALSEHQSPIPLEGERQKEKIVMATTKDERE